MTAMDDVERTGEELRHEPYNLLTNDCLIKARRLQKACRPLGIPVRTVACIGLARARLPGRFRHPGHSSGRYPARAQGAVLRPLPGFSALTLMLATELAASSMPPAGRSSFLMRALAVGSLAMHSMGKTASSSTRMS